jgi:hypothetical protein
VSCRSGWRRARRATIADREFGLVVGEPAEFRFLTSATARPDRAGALIDDWGDDIEEIGPLEVTLRLQDREDDVIPVTLGEPRDGDRDARAVVRRIGPQPAMEAGAQYS